MIRNDDEKRGFLEGVQHPDDTLLEEWVSRIRSGERGPEIDGIARRIIHDFALREFLNVPQSRVTIAWLADALGEILKYADPLHTLGVMPRPRSRPADPQRGWDVACWVSAAERRGYSRTEAIKLAAETFASDDSNIRKLLKKGPEWMAPADDWEDYFALRNRTLPPRKTGHK